jgi:ABC-type transporter Mla MlaB component
VGTRSQSRHDVYNDGVLRISRAGIPPVLVIAGEVDESTYPGLAATLKELADGQGANGRSETHINLAALTYCDLTGLRAIIGLAGAATRDLDGGGIDGGGGDGDSVDGDSIDGDSTDGGAAGGQGPGRCGAGLVLHEVPAHLRTVLHVVGWDTTPGLSYDDGEG